MSGRPWREDRGRGAAFPGEAGLVLGRRGGRKCCRPSGRWRRAGPAEYLKKTSAEFECTEDLFRVNNLFFLVWLPLVQLFRQPPWISTIWMSHIVSVGGQTRDS